MMADVSGGSGFGVQVFLRVRPEVASEATSGPTQLLSFDAQHISDLDSFNVADPTNKKVHKGFKGVFTSPDLKNRQIYQECLTGTSVMCSVTSGKIACVFAYGHTGSGKTYTIFGSRSTPGLYSFAAQELCAHAKAASTSEAKLFVSVRFVQLYQGRCQDLLTVGTAGKKDADGLTEMQVREDADGRMQICAPARKSVTPPFLWRQPGLETVLCETEEQVCEAVMRGLANRKVGQSGVHDESSRSHVFLEMELISDELAAEEAQLPDLEAAVFPLGHAAAGEEFRREDVVKAKFEEMYNKNAAGDSGQERGAVKNTAKDDAFMKFKKDVASLSVEERMKFDPEGWENGEPRLAVLERAVDAAEAEVRVQQVKVNAVKTRSDPCVGGKLVLVDLAGNEASIAANLVKPTPEQRKQVAEQKEINKSLFALKECIRGLHTRARIARSSAAGNKGAGKEKAGKSKPAHADQRADHIAFRSSRLTMVLKQYLSGSGAAHAVMIATASPSAKHSARTSDTLAYAALVASVA